MHDNRGAQGESALLPIHHGVLYRPPSLPQDDRLRHREPHDHLQLPQALGPHPGNAGLLLVNTLKTKTRLDIKYPPK